MGDELLYVIADAVLNGFGDGLGLSGVGIVEISDRADHFEEAMLVADKETKFLWLEFRSMARQPRSTLVACGTKRSGSLHYLATRGLYGFSSW